MRNSKLMKAQLACFNRENKVSAAEAFGIIKGMPHVKFDETVEVAFRLGIDPRKSDQTVRGAVPLPRGTGKSVTVTVISDDEALRQQAIDAGADFVGYDDIIEKIKGGWVDFDVLIASPSAMTKVRPLGRQLGPKGLMPNPKTGTVTEKVGNAVTEAKAGRVEFRADKGACVQVPIGKLSFDADALCENALAVVKAIVKAKPASAKGVYVQSFTLSATMTPGIRLDTREVTKEML